MSVSRLLESAFDQCDESCGWIAALIAAISYGTFGVPVKQTVGLDVHPFVLQSYKTFVMFVLSWLVIFLGESVRFTSWGLLSGFLWVVGGTGGIYGIRNAGMAIAVGTWSSIMILVNFLVGIVFFQEPVASFLSTCGAFACLGLGLIGMSRYSSTDPADVASTSSDSSSSSAKSSLLPHTQPSPQEIEVPPVVLAGLSSDLSVGKERKPNQTVTARTTPLTISTGTGAAPYDALRDPADATTSNANNASGGTAGGSSDEPDGLWRQDTPVRRRGGDRVFPFENRNISFSKRDLGVLGAVANGVFTGFSLVPLHYAKEHGFGGAAYMISFASGALFANAVIWALWFGMVLMKVQRDSNQRDSNNNNPNSLLTTLHVYQAYESMPPWHFQKLYIPGFSAGLLLAIAMFGSIMSVTYLGQGIGNSIIQSKILIR